MRLLPSHHPLRAVVLLAIPVVLLGAATVAFLLTTTPHQPAHPEAQAFPTITASTNPAEAIVTDDLSAIDASLNSTSEADFSDAALSDSTVQ